MEEDRDFIEFQGIKFYWHPFYKDYLASRCGKILSLKHKEKKILKFRNNGNNYLSFYFSENNKKRNYYIHRYVFETFKGEIPKGMHIDHCDFDRKNNSINNLQILSPKENQNKSICKKVISFDLETKEEKIFNSLKEAGEFYGIFSSNISKICKKKMKTSKSKKDGMRYKFSYL